MITIHVYSDYVCPYCFLGEHVLEKAIAGKEVQVEWMPFELRPEPTPTLLPEGDYLQNTWKNSVYPMAAELGVEIVLPSVSPQPYTHLAFEGYQYAKEHGKGAAYTHRMFTAFFQEEQDLGKIEVLTQLAGELELDTNAFREALESRKYKDKHQQELRKSAQLGIHAVPTFIIGNKMIPGLPHEEGLARLIDQEVEAYKRK